MEVKTQAEIKPKEEVKSSPVSKPNPKLVKNKDGFVKGQEVSNDDLFKHIAKQRAGK